MSEPTVEVAWSSLRRDWRNNDFAEIWFQFRPSGDGDAFPDFSSALDAANAQADANGSGADVFAEAPADSDKGPVGLMSRAGPEAGVRAWFAAFARYLEAGGWTGKVTAAPQANLPQWLNPWDPLPLQLTAYVAYRTTVTPQRNQSTAEWLVPPEVTERLARTAVQWGEFAGAQAYLRRYLHLMRIRSADLPQHLSNGLNRLGQAGLDYVQSKPQRVRHGGFSFGGEACYSVLDDSLTWKERLEKVTEPLWDSPADYTLAFVKYSWILGSSFSDLDSATPRPLARSYWHYCRHLYPTHTPDACGIQVLSDAHLQRAHDLSDWQIETISEGRHLVAAKDLASWYAQPEPDPEVVARARHDFGAMILTPELMAADLLSSRATNPRTTA